MAQAPGLRGLNREDFKDAPEWFDRVVEQLNPFINDTNLALSGKLTLSDNTVADVKEITVTVPNRTNATLENSFTTYAGNTPKYWMNDDGVVELDGFVTRGAGAPAAGTSIMTFPAEYYPRSPQAVPVASNNGANVFGVAGVSTAGVVTWESGGVTWFSLSGIRFRAAYAIPFTGAGWPITVKPSFNTKPAQVLVTRVEDTEKPGAVTAAPSVPDWTLSTNNTVQIRRVAGLSPGRTYRLTILVLG
jgi:hypothetical protein